MSAWEIVVSGLSALVGGGLGAWYQGRASPRAPMLTKDDPEPVRSPGRFLLERHRLYEEFFAASSTAFMAVGNYQLASRRAANASGQPDATEVVAASEELGRHAEEAMERVRMICYRLEMRDTPNEIVNALHEYVNSLRGILDFRWIPAEMHLSEERVRRLMRADLGFGPDSSKEIARDSARNSARDDVGGRRRGDAGDGPRGLAGGGGKEPS